MVSAAHGCMTTLDALRKRVLAFVETFPHVGADCGAFCGLIKQRMCAADDLGIRAAEP